MSSPFPRAFGPYTLLRRIATGGMAEIFLARAKGYGGFEKPLVIKRLHPQYSDDHEFVKMLVDEAKITVQLQHANVVQVFDLGRIGGQYYIALEYVEGHDLFQVLRELHGRDLFMPLEAACFVAQELCHGLHYAHCKKDPISGDRLGVIHRDVSPQNVLISWAGEVKLADFGIAKAAQRATHTQAGIIKGKFYYMSPEQALGLELDWRSDVFSAGIVLFEALTATPLYDDTDEETLVQRVRAAQVRLPSSVRPDVPPELDRICRKALAREPDARYATALDLARDLSEFLRTRDRAFTKVDLSEFVQSLYEERPDASSPGTDAADDVTMEEKPAPIPTRPDIKAPRASADRMSPVPPPTPPGPRPPVAEPKAAVAARSPVPPRAEPDPDAMTRQMPREAIEKANADFEATRVVDLVEEARTAPAPVPAPASRTPAPTMAEQVALGQRQRRARRRDNALRLAIAAVSVAIVAVATAIVWLLMHPIEVPAPAQAPAAASPAPAKAQVPPAAPAPEPAPEPRTKTALAEAPQPASTPPPLAEPEEKVRLRLRGLANEADSLYVDGQWTAQKDGWAEVTPGRHTIQVYLKRGGKTEKRTIVVEAGRDNTVDL